MRLQVGLLNDLHEQKVVPLGLFKFLGQLVFLLDELRLALFVTCANFLASVHLLDQ